MPKQQQQGGGGKKKRKFTPSSGKAKVGSRARRALKMAKHKLAYRVRNFRALGLGSEDAARETCIPMVDHTNRLVMAAARCGVKLPTISL